MDVRIGISDVAREVTVRTEATADDLAQALTKAIAEDTLFELTDAQGRQVFIPASKVAYMDLGSTDSRAVGFGAV